jgi:hypothetical protein
MQARSGWWRTPCTPSPARNSESTSEGRVAELLAPVHESVARLTTIPGGSHLVAHVLGAEVGLGMTRFPEGEQRANVRDRGVL